MLESLDQDNTFTSPKAIMFPFHYRKDMDTLLCSKLGTYKTLLK
jgi:hypothetical protein